ncbi:MAG: tRNA 4-thiouridine(8) synthase ThiI [Desulfurococcales archaeon ex4484_204]|nr:MAG: tRNA 4-thiouridine(8) synthase ThiI [Desulfurococcales archaeon ex4484_204]
MDYYYLVKEAPEIPLKSSRTRPRFELRLLRAIDKVLKRLGTQYKVRRVNSVLLLEANKDVINSLVTIFGIHSVCRVMPREFRNLKDIAHHAEELYRDVVKGRKFAVRVKRSGKHRFTSLDVASVVGAALKPYSAGVDLENPEVTVKIEVRGGVAYFIDRCLSGPKGLPVGVEGRVVSLFSGGYDSTLASWMIAKRGCKVDFLHLYMGSAESSEAAVDVAVKLSDWFTPYEPRFLVIDFTPVIAEIVNRVSRDYRQVVLRWSMHYIAQKVAAEHGYDAVVTGESIGQASSQTLKNLEVVERLLPGVSKRPILRPLCGMDKEEIISYIRELGLYGLTSRVKEACRIAGGAVATRAKEGKLKEEIGKLGEVLDLVYSALMEFKVSETGKIKSLIKAFTEDVEVDGVLEGAVLVDVRPRDEFDRWHPKGAIHVSEVLNRVAPDRLIITYCDKGVASTIYARALRAIGFKAYSLKGGVSRLKTLEG